MKIAIIEPVGGHGGMNYYDFSLAEGLVVAGADVIVYTCDRTDVPADLTFELKRTFKKIWGDAHKLLRAGRFTCCLLKTLLDARRKRVVLVHFHFFHYTLLENFCVSMARLFGFKIVVTAHDIESFGKQKEGASYRILSKADKVIAHNNVSKEELINKINLPLSKVVCIPHGNYLNSITELPTRKKARKFLALSSDHPVLLFFGQIKKAKGLDLLLRSLPRVVVEFPDLKLVIAGMVWKDDFEKYEKIIIENNLSGNINFHIRYIADYEVPYYFTASDLVVLPYRKIYQSGVLLMAMSYGTPVLVADLDGMTEIITNKENGFIFESESSKDLANSLITILSNPQKLKIIKEGAYNTIKQNYSWNRIGRLTYDCYKTIKGKNINKLKTKL